MREDPSIRFQTAVYRWYRRHGRSLPWRGERNPYRVLLSEVMLQQTQVNRVLEKYPFFLRRYPTLRALAKARRADVIRVWKGMGYNNRAVRLHQLAHMIVTGHDGRVPSTEKELTALPGIGRYTARAVLNSSFGVPVPIVEVNIQRLFSRHFWRMTDRTDKVSLLRVEARAASVFPSRRGYDWNQALMDLGATVCTSRSPQCTRCPVAASCKSRTRMGTARATHAKREPSLYGVPDRIYRGRVINRLRALKDGHTVSLEILGSIILPHFTLRNETWLRRLLAKLEREGLVRLHTRGTTTRVSLP